MTGLKGGEWGSTRGHLGGVARRRVRHNKHSQNARGIPPERKDPNMKTITKTIMYLQMTALFLTASLTGLAAADKAVPFRGTLQQVESQDVHFPILFAEASASGNATHLGRYTMSSEFQVNLLTLAGSGFAEFIAANGDTLFTAVTGQASPTANPDALSIVETFTITGGTGRFAGATGSFTGERLLNTVTNISFGSFDGAIVIHNEKHSK
jgi:hypothetical protein